MARKREALRTDGRTYTEPRPIYVSCRGRHIINTFIYEYMYLEKHFAVEKHTVEV